MKVKWKLVDGAGTRKCSPAEVRRTIEQTIDCIGSSCAVRGVVSDPVAVREILCLRSALKMVNGRTAGNRNRTQ